MLCLARYMGKYSQWCQESVKSVKVVSSNFPVFVHHRISLFSYTNRVRTRLLSEFSQPICEVLLFINFVLLSECRHLTWSKLTLQSFPTLIYVPAWHLLLCKHQITCSRSTWYHYELADTLINSFELVSHDSDYNPMSQFPLFTNARTYKKNINLFA